MEKHTWVDQFNGAITVCDRDGIILEMNEKSVSTFEKDGGSALIGKSLFDCHPEPARSKLKQLIDKRMVNVYTIEKQGKHKLIYQSPWYENSNYAGFVELSVEIPAEMEHFIRG